MKLSKDTVIIGGLPKPIGGVTSFLFRLVRKYPNQIFKFIDLYPSSNKNIPKEIESKFIQLRNKLSCIVFIVLNFMSFQKKELFFNFSTTSALIFFIFIPKINNKWSLMLHHGKLEHRYFYFLNYFSLKKFDKIYSINDRQDSFYKKYVSVDKIVRQNSYIPATLVDIDECEKPDLEFVRKLGLKIIIGSGCPKKIYQHDILIDIVEKNENLFLFLFLYDDGDLKDKYLEYRNSRVKIFFDKSEDVFNYYLSESDLYVRPTLEDSFGIACADAVEFGVKVIASDVCERYSLVETYSTNDQLYLYIENFLKE